jgi:hypothetical protein
MFGLSSLLDMYGMSASNERTTCATVAAIEVVALVLVALDAISYIANIYDVCPAM